MIPNDKILMSIQFKIISGGCVEGEMQSNAKWLPNDFIAKIHKNVINGVRHWIYKQRAEIKPDKFSCKSKYLFNVKFSNSVLVWSNKAQCLPLGSVSKCSLCCICPFKLCNFSFLFNGQRNEIDAISPALTYTHDVPGGKNNQLSMPTVFLCMCFICAEHTNTHTHHSEYALVLVLVEATIFRLKSFQ